MIFCEISRRNRCSGRGRARARKAEVLFLTLIILLRKTHSKKLFRFDLVNFRSEISSRDEFLAQKSFLTRNGRYLDEHAVFVERENLIKRELVEQIWRSKKEARKFDLANKVMTQMSDQQRNISKKGKVSCLKFDETMFYLTHSVNLRQRLNLKNKKMTKI